MKLKIFVYLFLIFVSNKILTAQNIGFPVVKSTADLNPYFSNYPENLKKMWSDEVIHAYSLDHIDMSYSEHALMLDYLYPVIDTSENFRQLWINHSDSLFQLSKNYQEGYFGVIPLEARYFLESLDYNSELNAEYPNSYNFLKENTPSFEGLGYSSNQYAELLIEFGISNSQGAKGRFEIFSDILLIDTYKVIELIKVNQDVKNQFDLFLKNSTDVSYEYVYSEAVPPEMLARRKLLISERFSKMHKIYFKNVANTIENIKIRSEFKEKRKVYINASHLILSEKWSGKFGPRFMNLGIVKIEGDSIWAYNKIYEEKNLRTNPVKEDVSLMKGTFSLENEVLTISLNEIGTGRVIRNPSGQKICFSNSTPLDFELINMDEKCQDSQELWHTFYWMNEPEFNPNHDNTWDGKFNIQINTATKQMNGSWEAFNGRLKREFSFDMQ